MTVRNLLAATMANVLFMAATATAQQAGSPPPPAVTVVTLKAEDVTLTSVLPGRVQAAAEAEVRPQVNGIITERLFDEGSAVESGDVLFRIDPRNYEAAVAQAEAALAQANAQAEAARREADRVGQLRDRRVASEQTEDTAIASRDAADAAVKVAEAQLQNAQIDLDRTTITAQLDGVIGFAGASQGALVTAGQATPLAVIRQIDPVHIDVTQSAAEVIRWRRAVASGQEKALATEPTVTLKLADGSTYEYRGTLTAAEPYVNETTGVVTLRMLFPNPEKVLLPGMYVQAEIPQAVIHDAILAPQQGVSRDQRGRPIALIVNAENVVEQRDLTILQDDGNRWIVSEGLADGDRLIIEGVQRIGVGMPVTPEEQQAAPAPAEATDNGSAAAAAQPDAPTDGDAPAQAGADTETQPAGDAETAQ